MASIVRLLRGLLRGLAQFFRYRSSMAKLGSLSAQREVLTTVLDAYQRGDYETGLQAAEGLRASGCKTAAYCFFRGSILMQLGRWEEAEKSLRENVAREEKGQQAAVVYSTLGELLLQRHRYDEAMECFETSQRHSPERGSTHRCIAETWLRRGHQPAEALQWARRAVEEDRAAQPLSQEVHDLNLSEDLATLAWAVAVASRDEAEVDRLAAEAVPLVGARSASSTAQVHYQLGRAYAALGNTNQSKRYFEEAARADPKGMWGRAAVSP